MEHRSTTARPTRTFPVPDPVPSAADLARVERHLSPGGLTPDSARTYAAPPRLLLNQWALAGRWTVSDEHAVLDAAPGAISFRFRARDLHLVLGRSTELTDLWFVNRRAMPLPPEPIRSIGAKAVTSAMALDDWWCDRAQTS